MPPDNEDFDFEYGYELNYDPGHEFHFEENEEPIDPFEILDLEYGHYVNNTHFLIYKTLDYVIETGDWKEIKDYLLFVYEQDLMEIKCFHQLCLDKEINIYSILPEDEIDYIEDMGYNV